jgi:hypothetical protein
MTVRSRQARVAGALYLLASAVGVVRMLYIPTRLIVAGNAAATAANLRAHEVLFRWGLVSQLVGAVLWLLVVLALHRLLKDVDERPAKRCAALTLAMGGGALDGIGAAQREALAYLFLRLHHLGDLANEIFWGLWLLPFGRLVVRSRFLPRVLGLVAHGGVFRVAGDEFCRVRVSRVGRDGGNWAQPATIGELVMMLWLLAVGARERPMSGSAS